MEVTKTRNKISYKIKVQVMLHSPKVVATAWLVQPVLKKLLLLVPYRSINYLSREERHLRALKKLVSGYF